LCYNIFLIAKFERNNDVLQLNFTIIQLEMEKNMTIADIMQILDAKLLTTESDIQQEINSVCGSDMMSDVLAYVKDQSLLVTGLNNLQVIRTADMMDILCVLFVRDKVPDETILKLAKEREIAVIATDKTMFTACGLLYNSGLRGGAQNVDWN